jgi:hypothetical protein
MQITLKIALIVVGFALASFQAFAADMPTDGTKNFSSPSDAPSYFTNETVPESARVNHQATFDSQEVPESTAAEERTVSETGHYGRHASYRSARHAHGRFNWHAGSTHFVRAASGASRTAPHTSRGQAGASKTYTPKHARSGRWQHAASARPVTI